MTRRYEDEIILEDPGQPPERSRYSIGGVLVGLAVAIAVIAGMIGFGRVAADRISGIRIGEPDAVATDVEPGIERTINVPPGSSARDIASLLVDARVVGSAGDFETAVRSRGVSNLLQAGDYVFETGMTVDAAIDVLLEGPVFDTYRLIVREGLRVSEVLEAVAEQSEFDVPALQTALESGQVTSEYLPAEVEGLVAWEGLLFPDTYEFFADATAVEILQRLSDEFTRNMAALDFTIPEERGLSKYEVVVMASMIESEAQLNSERPTVSSVLYNRLEQGIALQIDATVLYALGERRTGLTLADLEVDSPYNTYLVAGLPPTPIAVPGLASLVAATRPEQTDYLYYVLTSTDGSHSFTSDYNEFLRLKDQAKADGILP